MSEFFKRVICLCCVLSLCISNIGIALAAGGSSLGSAENMGKSGIVEGEFYDNTQDGTEFYKYVVDQGNSVELKIKLTSQIFTTYVYVYDAEGNRVYDKDFYVDESIGQKTEKFTFYLNPGIYYIGIHAGYSVGKYSMEYETKVLNNFDTIDDNTLTNARSIPLTTKISGIVSEISDDNVDIYKLTVDKPGILKQKLKFYMGSISYRLLDQDGRELDENDSYWNGNTQIGIINLEYPLEKGVYYFAVERYGEDGRYEIEQHFYDIGSTETESNDLITEAQNISLGKKMTGIMGIGDESDFYKIHISSKRNITFNVQSKAYGMRVYLYDRAGDEIKCIYPEWNNNTKEGKIYKIYKLSEGDYYVQFKSPYETVGKYTFTISTTKAPSICKITKISGSKKYYFGRKIYMKWTKSTGAEGYQVYIANNLNFKYANKYSTRECNYTTRGYKTGKTYYIKVRSYKKNSDGEYIFGKFSTVKKIKL